MTTSPRYVLDLSRGWDFVPRREGRRWLGGGALAAGVEAVDLPHSWNERDTFQDGVSYRQGWGSYRGIFRVPREEVREESVWKLGSEGFYGWGELWLNGTRLGAFDGQYLGFSFDVGCHLRWDGDNVIGIRLSNRYRRDVLPARRNPDFVLHGGLAGRIGLRRVPDLHLDCGSVRLRCTGLTAERATVEVCFAAVNRSRQARRCEVCWRLLDVHGTVVARSERVALEVTAGGDARVTALPIVVPDPVPWTPDQPSLYSVEAELVEVGTVVDSVTLHTGLRTAEFRPHQGFFLNGERLDLHGCNRHESMPGFGAALPEELHRQDAELLKEMGCNLVRLSHYPQHPAFLDACDELGILVYAEVASWKSVDRGPWLRAARRQLRDMILRDRNRPSVILWGMGNESRSRQAYLELGELAHELDPDRPVTYAENHLYRARRQRTIGLPDVWGVNYELDVLAEACEASRLKNVVLSECNNHPRSVRGDADEELRQLAELERGWEAMADRPFVAGHAIWCFADYATLYRKRYRRHAGLCDAWRQPKRAATLFRARYGREPVLEMFLFDGPSPEDCRVDSRFRLQIESPLAGVDPGTELHVLSNCDAIRVSCDGDELATLAGALHYVVPIASGVAEIAAVGTRHGVELTRRLPREGEARGIVLEAEIEELAAGQPATVGVRIRVIDDDGVVVTGWNGHLQVELDGPARLQAYTPADEVLVSRGEGRTWVTTTGRAGVVEVSARGPGLEAGTVRLEVSDGGGAGERSGG